MHRLKHIFLPGLAVLVLAFSEMSLAQNAKTNANGDKLSDAQTNSTKATLSASDLEANFKAWFTKATLTGRWCALKDGQLGPDKEDKYTILSVAKVSGDHWVINARIQYGGRDITTPIPVQVKWAADTAIIVVDKIGIPGGSTYSARLLIYEKTYSGTWTGGTHGGLMHGVITNEKE